MGDSILGNGFFVLVPIATVLVMERITDSQTDALDLARPSGQLDLIELRGHTTSDNVNETEHRTVTIANATDRTAIRAP